LNCRRYDHDQNWLAVVVVVVVKIVGTRLPRAITGFVSQMQPSGRYLLHFTK
jgi:hypothetical protein